MRPPSAAVDSWLVDQSGGKIIVREKRALTPAPARRSGEPGRIVIVGGGAAGFAAAEMLRRRKYEGQIVMLSADDSPPVDRPNLSKDYLAGSAPEDWLPLRPAEFYRDNAIDLRLQATVERLDAASREVDARGRRKRSVRPAPPRHRRRARAAIDSGDVAVGNTCPALARRLPSNHRAGQDRKDGPGARRELHRA